MIINKGVRFCWGGVQQCWEQFNTNSSEYYIISYIFYPAMALSPEQDILSFLHFKTV